MKFKFRLLFSIFCFCALSSNYAQQIKVSGVVNEQSNSPVQFVNIIDSSSLHGATTNENGEFEFTIPFSKKITLKISCVGYIQQNLIFNSDSLQKLTIVLEKSIDFLDEIVVSSTLSEISKKESPIPVEVFSARYLNKTPNFGLLEASQTINGLRPQLNCAVCNTGDIHINGMEGPYTMVTIDGMPIVGGLSTVYGLQGIPSSLLQRVEVVKGPASTLYGSEAVAGLINVITKSIECAPKLAVNLSATSWSELQADATFTYAETKKVSGIFGIDYLNYSNPIDNNGDNFTDLTLKDRVSIYNKWRFNRKINKKATLSARYMYEDRWGGEMQWNPSFRGGDSIYGESIYTNRAELIGLYELPTEEHLSASGSYSFHNQDSRYGDLSYLGQQHIAFGQLIWNKMVGDKHAFVSGLALRYNHYDDNTPITSVTQNETEINQPTKWIIPSIFSQDNFSINKNMNLLLGARLDFHSAHGAIFTPRLNWKWSPSSFVFRLGYGNGFRVVNVFSEDHAALTGAREVVISENLNPERSNNINLNVENQFNTQFFKVVVDGSIFYTHFSNKIIPDYSVDSQISYSNLDGYGVSRGIALNAKVLFNFPLTLNVGATFLDVYSFELNSEGNMEKQDQLFTEPYSLTWSATYKVPKFGMALDFTGNLYGPMKLPVVENDFRPEFSEPFSIANLKVSKDFSRGFSVNIGVRNLLNFTPPSYSILRPNDPFDNNIDDPVNNPNNYSFDPSYMYASFQGISYFVGLKYVFN